MGKDIELTASDNFKPGAYRADPVAAPKGAVVVIQEIFGVNDVGARAWDLIDGQRTVGEEIAAEMQGALRPLQSADGALCLALESIFAAVKREELRLSTAMLDAIHPALAALATLCTSPGVPPSPGRVTWTAHGTEVGPP